MKPITSIITIAVAVFALTACNDKTAEQRTAVEEANAKARAEASRKEMEKLPETFKPRYNKKLEPDSSKGSTGVKKADSAEK